MNKKGKKERKKKERKKSLLKRRKKSENKIKKYIRVYVVIVYYPFQEIYTLVYSIS